jgi:N-acetylglucosamine-6-phosphate deacetylase
MRTLIEHGTLLLESGEIRDGWLLIKGGVIEALGAAEERPRNVEATHIDAKGAYISPGFIDIHVHGGGGHDFMDGTEDAFVQASRLHLVHGTTALVPTTLIVRSTIFAAQRASCLTMGRRCWGCIWKAPTFLRNRQGRRIRPT